MNVSFNLLFPLLFSPCMLTCYVLDSTHTQPRFLEVHWRKWLGWNSQRLCVKSLRRNHGLQIIVRLFDFPHLLLLEDVFTYSSIIVIPDFGVCCRRLTPGPGYLEALCEDNVILSFVADIPLTLTFQPFTSR